MKGGGEFAGDKAGPVFFGPALFGLGLEVSLHEGVEQVVGDEMLPKLSIARAYIVPCMPVPSGDHEVVTGFQHATLEALPSHSRPQSPPTMILPEGCTSRAKT